MSVLFFLLILYEVGAIKKGLKSTFLSHQADMLSKLPTHELVVLVEYQLGWMKIVYFSQIVYFKFSPIFFRS